MRDGPKHAEKADWLMDAGPQAAGEDADDAHVFPTPRGVLTAAEIEALLRPNLEQTALSSAPDVPAEIVPKPAEIFDTEVTGPTPEHEAHAQRLAARLAMAMGNGAGVKAAFAVTDLATVARRELPGLMQGKSSAVACIGPTETDIRALICLPPTLSDAVIAKACGARGTTGRIGDGWTLSAIDCALLEQLLIPLGPALHPDYRLQAIETDVAYVSSLLAVSDVQVSEYAVEAPGLHSELAVIEGQRNEHEAPAETSPLPRSAATPEASDLTAVVTARLASLTVPLSRLTELKAGSTLLLGLPADQPVELLSGDRDAKVAFEGRMGRKGNKMAIKITKRMRSFGR